MHRALLRFVMPVVAAALVAPAVALAQTAQTVLITDRLSPSSLTVSTGSTVTWMNEDAERHRVRSHEGPDEFDSGNLETGERYSFVFRREGTYRYRDDRDREDTRYHGTIIVRSAPSNGTPGEDGTQQPPSAPATASVSMAGRRFSPSAVEIAAGGTVTWRNDDDRQHTVTANDRSFDSGIMQIGVRFTRTFPSAGRFGYLCLIHPDMTGTVVVVGLDGRAPPSAAPPPPSKPQQRQRPAGGTPGGAGIVEVTILDFAFSPALLEVPAGTEVRWRNDGQAPHTVTAEDELFDSGILASGEGSSFRFDRAGIFAYVCTLHPQMRGRIAVDAPAPSQGSERDVRSSPLATPPPGDDARTGSSVPEVLLSRASPVDDVLLSRGAVLSIILGIPALIAAAIIIGARRRPVGS